MRSSPGMDPTSSAEALTSRRQGFAHSSQALAALYREWYELIRQNLSSADGICLEIGSGAGFLKQVLPQLITSDVVRSAEADLVLDAKEVGTRYANAIANLILVNAFHHIDDSGAFLDSAYAALVPGGRLILIEPSHTRWSRMIYPIIGHEPYNCKQQGWTFTSLDPLMDSNQAQSWIVFERDRVAFQRRYPAFRILSWRAMMPFSYIATGGHSLRLPIPTLLIRCLRRLERRWLDPGLGIFSLIVIEKAA